MDSHTRLAACLPPARVSQVPRLICPRALSPLTPESPTNASAHCFFVDGRLQFSGTLATLALRNEAESGSLALRLTCSPHEASQLRLL